MKDYLSKFLRQYHFCLLSLVFIAGSAHAQLRITDLRTNYQKNPIGTDVLHPAFSWKQQSEVRSSMQRAYELRVTEDLSGKVIWNTGRISSEQSVNVRYNGPALLSGRRYFWQVRTWDQNEKLSKWSERAFWEMGLLQASDWKAKWISSEQQTNGAAAPAVDFRKSFRVKSHVRSARLYTTALGLYETMLNGQKVSDHYFAPGWTSYNHRIQYQTYDVTSLLKTGENAALTTVGDGWYRGNLGYKKSRGIYGKEAGLLYQLVITYLDGTQELIVSDESWKSSFDGPVRASDIYNGEIYDASRAHDASLPGFNITGWKGVRVIAWPEAKLVAQFGPPVRSQETLNPKKITRLAAGDVLIDFGQNLVGWAVLRLTGRAGDSVQVQHAEVLDKNGNFYTENLRAAAQQNTYMLDGQERWYSPLFSWQGFRYIRIKGYTGQLDSVTVHARAVYSDMDRQGTFETSNALVNQLQKNIQWGQKGNFIDVPTDCPQRDERLGWTGDAQVFFNTAAFNMDVSGFFIKWLQDLRADQRADGMVPAVIPDIKEQANSGSAGWGDVSTIIPWNFYRTYGDRALLDTQYNSMKAWVGYIKGISKNNLWNSGRHYGDWLFYEIDDDRDGKSAITDKYLIAQAFWAASVQNVINAARVLGRKEDEAMYTAMLADIKQAFMREYVTPSGRMVSSSQTAYVLALQFDMLPDSLRAQAAERLVDNIKSYNYHLTTGFLGTPYLCHVLSRFGYADIAYRLLLQETYPSWLYPVKKGATTIWERWDGIKPNGTFQTPNMNSFNHYAYGAIGEWMYRNMAGIDQQEGSIAYRELLISPRPGGNFTNVRASLETAYGQVYSGWHINSGQFKLEVRVPVNSRARIVLPGAAGMKVFESGKPLSSAKGITNPVTHGNDIELEAGSGHYIFTYNQTK
ncbi:alpha-L-rhamnosidase [Pedobacter sp. SYP-B3415]|uniref:alpha-L-rhamnosidase n=1 Tax=Pedobacter sp. SYP-B3415 TaxID=2496641 RepID=UPI00101D38DE|nr:alpha-L-rhamnosidase [Pedobacter sp. SYP-B3415]